MGGITFPTGVVDRYVDDLLAKVDLELLRPAAFKVLVDYDNGVTSAALGRVLEEMNCSVIPLNASIEPPLMPQGTEAVNARLQEMGVIVRAVRARMGIFIDSPGERSVLIDEMGEVPDHETGF